MTKKVFDDISRLALKALLYEVSLSPKPGLVDQLDNGAHDDMSFLTFVDSALALAPFFKVYLDIGFYHAKEDPSLIFERLRASGIEAEQAMFSATKGVNTHKGVNFSLALLLGATGMYLADQPQLLDHVTAFTEEDSLAICQLVKPLTAHLLETDFGSLDLKKELTYGEKLFLDYGIKGPRGEASEGYPTIAHKALPFLRKSLRSTDQETAQLQLLVYLMSIVEDGNLIHRGGIKAWQQVKQDMQLLHNSSLSTADLKAALSAYNDKLIQKHLSPGGTADLLVLSLYFAFLENQL